MKKTILFCGYREWSREIYKKIQERYGPAAEIIEVISRKQLKRVIKEKLPHAIFFVGWSWIVKEDVLSVCDCICLHASPLPKYRGGSALQHQIMSGETKSAVTLFKMGPGLDDGDILYQGKFSLDSNLKDIFDRIILKGIDGISKVLEDVINNKKLVGTKQNESDATLFKRRKPYMSEIKIDDFRKNTAKEIHNKIRSLQDPYPNAYVVCEDGAKLFLILSRLENE